jgi:hypothetical protein
VFLVSKIKSYKTRQKVIYGTCMDQLPHNKKILTYFHKYLTNAHNHCHVYFFRVHTNLLPHDLSHKKHYSQVVSLVNKSIITFFVYCKQA